MTKKSLLNWKITGRTRVWRSGGAVPSSRKQYNEQKTQTVEVTELERICLNLEYIDPGLNPFKWHPKSNKVVRIRNGTV